MSDASLGTKQTCPKCEAKFYDLGALDVCCPKCGYVFVAADFDCNVSVALVAEEKPSAKQENKDIAPLEVEISVADEKPPVKEVAMLEADEDYPDIHHLAEVEDHHEAPEVDVNSDDADDEMFMEELDHGEAALLSEFEHVDPDGYRGDEAVM